MGSEGVTKKETRKRLRFPPKINEDTMTSIVVYSLLFCVAVVVAGFVFLWFDKDASAIISSALAVFGTELGICGVMKIFDRNNEAEDRRREERQRRAEERKQRKAAEASEKQEFQKGLRENEGKL